MYVIYICHMYMSKFTFVNLFIYIYLCVYIYIYICGLFFTFALGKCELLVLPGNFKTICLAVSSYTLTFAFTDYFISKSA